MTKPRRSREPDIIDDLEDQAAWSSYTQHIPRAGNFWRQWIWSNRYQRLFRDRRYWLGLGIAFGLVTVAALIYWAISSFLGP